MMQITCKPQIIIAMTSNWMLDRTHFSDIKILLYAPVKIVISKNN